MPEPMGQGASLMMGSNQVIEDPQSAASILQPDEEVKEIRMIMAWQREAANNRKQFDKHWGERRKAYKGKTWQAQKSSEAKQQPEMNLIRVVVQTILPILTDANPGFNVLPRDPTDIKFTQMLSDSMDSLWDRLGMPTRIVEVLMDQSILDNGCLKVFWNPDLEDGRGDIDIEVKDPENIWVNKGAIDFDRECKVVIERVIKTVGEWKRMFPKVADRIHADSTSEQKQKEEAERPTSEVTLVSPVDQDKNKNADPGEAIGDDNSYAEGWEVWYQDDSVVEFELEGSDGKPPEKQLRKKFPNGHLTTLLPWQKIILQSVENPNEGPNFNPYVRFVDTVMPREFYGEGLVESLIDIQKMLNKVAQTIVEYMRLMSNPIWIADKTSGVNWDKVTNKVGLIILKEAGTEVRRDIPPPIPGYIFEFFRLLQSFSNEVSGVHDVTQGRKPAGVTAAEAIETLQEAAHTRVRLKERNMQVSLSKLAKLVIAMMLQKYRAPRYHRVAGADAEVPTFVEFGIDDGAQDGTLAINRRTWAYDPNQGKYVSTPLETAQATKGLFDVKVQAGTSMPFAKASRSNLAIRLAEGGFIDQTALLETLEWDKSSEVVNRMEAKKQADAQAAMKPQPAAMAA